MANKIALAMEQVCFCVKETTKGTAVFPTTAAEMVVGAGVIDINQNPAFTNSEEIINSLDVIDRFMDQIGKGDFTIPTYVRPSGTAGSVPAAGVLFESLMGVETVTGGTSVAYSQATVKPSFTLWVKKSHTVFFGAGACVDKGAFEVTNKGGAKFTFSGGLMRMGWAGTDAVSGAVSGSTSVTVVDGKKYTEGAFVKFDADDNSGDGYRIDSVSGNVLTMDDSITCGDGAIIAGYLPESFTVIGEPLESRESAVTIAGTDTRLKSMTLDVGSPVVYQDEEITTSGYTEEYVEDTRDISGKLDILFRQDDLRLFYEGLDNTSKAVVIKVGDAAGSIFTIGLPYSELEVPTISSNKPTVDLSMNYTVLGSVGEDSATFTFS